MKEIFFTDESSPCRDGSKMLLKMSRYWIEKMLYGLDQWFPKSAPRTMGGPRNLPSGPRITIQINNLCFADYQIILSGPRIGKVWEPLV